MQITYDLQADTLYIQLTNNVVVASKQITPTFACDLDEHGQVTGVEILHARQSGVNPLALELFMSPDEIAERPNQEAIQQDRKARMETLRQQRESEAENSSL